MGNSIATKLSNVTGKVILPTGEVLKYDKPLTVAELMLEHPQQMVVELQKSGKKLTPLPADKKLEINKVYLMLPAKRAAKSYNLSFSSEEAHRVLANANFFPKSKLSSWVGLFPLFVRICSASKGVFTNNNNSKNLLVERKEEEESKSDYFSDILEGRPEFLSKQLSGKGWKPSLDTIKEKTFKAKVRHWLLL